MIIKKTGLLNKLVFTVKGWDLKTKYITLYDIKQLLRLFIYQDECIARSYSSVVANNGQRYFYYFKNCKDSWGAKRNMLLYLLKKSFFQRIFTYNQVRDLNTFVITEFNL